MRPAVRLTTTSGTTAVPPPVRTDPPENEPGLPFALHVILRTALRVAGARYAALGVIASDGRHEQFLHAGFDQETVRRIGDLPQGRGLLGALLDQPRSIRIPDVARDPRAVGFPPGHPIVGAFLGVPVRTSARVCGRLYLGDPRGRAEFSAEDEELVEALAATAGLAIENARGVEENLRRLARLEERDRVGQDLHDTVVQRLFAAGLGLEQLATLVPGTSAAHRVVQLVEDLDETIRQVRSSVFALHGSSPGSGSTRRAVTDLVNELACVLGLGARLHLDGPLDTLVGAGLRHDLEQVVRAALTEVARCPAATSVDVSVRVDPGHVELQVTGDGRAVGPDPESRLAALQGRARQAGGSLTLKTAPRGGLELRWSIPLAL